MRIMFLFFAVAAPLSFSSLLFGENLMLHGVIQFHPQKSQHLHSPYQGVVKQIQKSIGDQVKPGDTLETVESQSGLQNYALVANIQGSVVARNIAVGQSVGPDIEAFVVADPQEVIGLFRVPVKYESQLKQGAQIKINSDTAITGKITFVSPILDEHSRSILVHALFPNPDSRLREGQLISAEVIK